MNLPLVNDTICAVDIGLNGGVCFNTSPHSLLIYEADPNLKTMWLIINGSSPEVIVAENVHTFAGQGIKSSGTLMESKGILRGFAAAIGIELKLIEPLKWIETFTLKRGKHFLNTKGKKDKTAWKRHLLSIAKTLAPEEYHDQLNLKTADAFLIWYYYAKVLRGEAKPIGFTL